MTVETPAKTDAQREWKWKVEAAAASLREAQKVEGDPKLHKAAIAELKRQREAITEAIKGNPAEALKRRAG